MIVPELQLFQIKREVLLGDAMMFDQPLLGPAPESLHAVDVNLTGREILAVVHLQMPVSAEHEAVVAPEFVRINHRSSADLLDREPQKGFRRDIGHNIHMDQAVSFQDAKDGNLAGSASAPVSFSPASEVALIQFDLSTEKSFSIFGMTQNSPADGHDGIVNRSVGQLNLACHLPCGDFQFKELDQGEPLNAAQAPLVDPSA